MKLSGNKRGGRHLTSNVSRRKSEATEKPAKRKKRKVLRIISLSFLGILAVGVIVFARWWQTEVILPDVTYGRRNPRPPVNSESNNPSGLNGEYGVDPDRPADPIGDSNPYKFTFLVLGTDLGDVLTDVIMVVSFDTENYKMNIVSIPRDTLVNVNWSVRKANSIYANMRHRHRGETDAELRREMIMESTIDYFANLLGFPVDFYLLVDTRAFIRLVDSVGGVDFNIPVRMTHEEFLRAYSPGPQRLSGREALDIVRFRGFASGDIGRIGTQQNFLETAAQQILERRSSIRYPDIISIFLNYVETDLTSGNLVAFARHFLRMDSENVNFATLPGDYTAWIAGVSYVTVYVDEWLEMVNEMLNPFYADITTEDVSILTRGSDRRLFVTDGNFAGNPNWGQPSGSGGASSPTNNAPTTPTAPTNPPATPGGNQTGNPPDTGRDIDEDPDADQPSIPTYGENPPDIPDDPDDDPPPQIPDANITPDEPLPTDPPPESDD
ncbi:MAG: LCP family protein [Oscillospiraceae bacterium]|nr:LCP family protein [Oscillospiraceae bacterium]